MGLYPLSEPSFDHHQYDRQDVGTRCRTIDPGVERYTYPAVPSSIGAMDVTTRHPAGLAGARIRYWFAAANLVNMAMGNALMSPTVVTDMTTMRRSRRNFTDEDGASSCSSKAAIQQHRPTPRAV